MSRDDLPHGELVSAEVRKLIDAALNGTIDEAGLRDLDAALLDQPAVQSFFLEYCQLHIDLMIDTRAGQVLDEFRQRRERATPIPPLGVEESGPLAPMSPPSVTGFMPWLAGGGAMLALALLVIATLSSFRGGDPAGVRVVAHSAETPKGELPSVQLLAGTAKLTLPKIGYVIVEGPATFEMIDPMRARLSEGRVRVNVTEKTGYGFVIETPHGKVTDLGTEFGLNVPREGKVGLVVFNGMVDLEVNDMGDQPDPAARVSRLVRGEGVTFDDRGQLDRINSIVTGAVPTFLPLSDTGEIDQSTLIASVHDDLRTGDTKKFYEIVPGGLGEDVLAYVDRPHEWNGVTSEGMPEYLMGADYIKTFSDDKVRSDTKIYVALSRPAKLYVFYDDKLKPPKWLQKDFRKVKGKVGMDLDSWPTISRPVERGDGPGDSIDHHFDVWERIVNEPGVVTFGANGRLALNGRPSKAPYMYGIAAVALDSDKGQEIKEP